MAYIDIPTDTEPIQLAGSAFEFIQTYFPNWTPNAAALSTILIQANAETAAEVKDVSSKVPTSIFRYFGDSLSNIHPVVAAPATVDSTWTMVNSAGYTIEDGTTVIVRNDTGGFVGFIVVGGPYVIAPGSTSTGAGAVALQAVIAGEAANELDSGNAAAPQDQLAFVSSISLVGTSGGGAEAESDETYLSRLSEELTLQSPMPILAPDFAVLARRIPGVFRATAIDNWNTASGTGGWPNMVSIFAVDSLGNAVSSTVKTAISNYFEAIIAQNFVCNVGNPTYTTVDCHFTVSVEPGAAPTPVREAAEQAVRDYLSKANWGNPPGSDPAKWINNSIVRINKVIQVIENTSGVDFVPAGTVTLNGAGIDVILPGAAPLPQPGTVDGTAI